MARAALCSLLPPMTIEFGLECGWVGIKNEKMGDSGTEMTWTGVIIYREGMYLLLEHRRYCFCAHEILSAPDKYSYFAFFQPAQQTTGT